ncbi:MAG: AAA family ATPase [Anaerolineae bacterium]|nr:AAA family ATPase [Anaerolineae bacterium]
MQGYKSFANRTELAFPTGITAIVGPNGSGKSNVADAIRWALGEQSARTLRGKSTADMIFTGGQRRARAGMAEVLLTLDNADGWLPLEFVEVVVGRRAYRSGESEYLLNDNRVRLRDMVDLLAESGLSQRTYTVIGQGMVDAALSLRAQERRMLFEEAAGIAVYRSRREEAAGRLEETARNLERVHDILSEINPRLKRLREQAERFQEYERISAHLRRLQRAWYGYHWGQAQEVLRSAQQRAGSLAQSLQQRQAEVERITHHLLALRRQQTELRGRLRDGYRRIADLHDQADAVQREAAALTERARLLAVQREEIAQEIEPLHTQQEAQARQVQVAQDREAEMLARVGSEEERVAHWEEELAVLRRQAQGQAQQHAAARVEVERLQAQKESLQQSAAEAREAYTRLEAERELLAQLREESAGFAHGLRSLLQSDLPGVVGLLSKLIQVPAEWERAVEAALGPRTQSLLVRDWAAVEAARSLLPPGERAVLLPIDRFSAPSWSAPAGRLVAAEAVDCPASLRPAVDSLLGRTLLVDDLASARALSTALPPGGQCVTQAGTVVAADGSVMLGGGGGLLAQERTWRELPGRMEAAQRRQEELAAEMERLLQALSLRETALAEAAQGAADTSAQISRAESGPLAQARTALAVARQTLDAHRVLLQRELADLQRIAAQAAAQQERVKELRQQQARAGERLAQLQAQGARFEEELAQLRSWIGPGEEELGRMGQEQEEVETQERQARARARRLEEQINSAQLEVARAEDRLARLQERIQEDLGLVELEVAEEVTAQALLPLRPLVSRLPIVELLPDGLREEIQWLKGRLRQLGPVNPNAPQEYAETGERHRFLSDQVADLEKTSARLAAVIADLDERMKQAFHETFGRIAAAFEDTFQRLFNGGMGRLELTAADDLMDAGVEIVARPPGKRMQSLALLSGGERALTAAALIFAILRVSPTPFCVLDEVDAMLDESNVVRFRSLLEELSQETQFVVITHNRGTVEAADVVYGVSMGSDGVSQMVSLRLKEVVDLQ